MAAADGFDLFCIPNHAISSFAGIGGIADHDSERCNRCGFAGCDLKILDCGCIFHARCFALNHGVVVICPHCSKPMSGLFLLPMSFKDIDEAQKAVVTVSKARSRKRKGMSDDGEDKDGYISERRTGRWTNEEVAFCDKLIAKFESGDLPVSDGTKLNEFLGNMLKSKQSRLTKKMKNAKLSTRTFTRTTGCLLSDEEAREFSELEDAFFQAVQDARERAEIKFHMQKEWREQFSHVCSALGQPLDAEAWLSSVEEMDRRASQARDTARMAKRKRMMGVALRTDSKNPESGVFIEKTEAEIRAASVENGHKDFEEEMLSILAHDAATSHALDFNGKSGLLHSAPFLAKATAYLQRHAIPFEHVDIWVPSFVPGAGNNGADQSSCRLCYAGCSTVDKLVSDDGKSSRGLTADEQFNLFAFGDYSQKFSFDVGCGLPGRVYESGRPTWEQSVHNAPHHHFERCGGALQWGIKTVVGIPIASPNVGRIVVILYSIFDREKNEDLVSRLFEEFTKLMPSPKWKLVVDIGDIEETTTVPIAHALGSAIAAEPLFDTKEEGHDTTHSLEMPSGPVAAGAKDRRIDEVIALLGEFMPSDPASPLSEYLSGFMSLRLLLLRPSRTLHDEELVKTMLDSYTSYTGGGRDRSEIAIMLARDFMFLNQQQADSGDHPSFLAFAPGFMSESAQGTNNSNLSLFGLPSTSSSLQNSPVLTPIPAPGNIDALSIVSN